MVPFDPNEFRKEFRAEIREDIDHAVNQLALVVARGFERVDKKFDEMEDRFEEVDLRFDAVDLRFQKIERYLPDIPSTKSQKFYLLVTPLPKHLFD